MGRQKNVANARAIGEEHDEAIDPHAFAGRRRQAVLQGPDVIGVVVHRFLVARSLRPGLFLETRRLVFGVVQLGEAVRDLAPADVQLETLGDLRISVAAPRERRYLRRVVDYEGRLDKLVLDCFERLELENGEARFWIRLDAG